jgi:type IV pilus biogenesis protein CpaD/CtpE
MSSGKVGQDACWRAGKTRELNYMKVLVIVVAATALLSACAQRQETQQVGMSRNQPPPSNFQSIGSCEPTAWASLERDSWKLPPDQREHVMVLLQDAQSQHADANLGQCIIMLQQAEKIVRQGTGSS